MGVKEKAVEKPITAANVREMASALHTQNDPDSIFREVSILLKSISSRKNGKEMADKILLERSAQILMACGVGNQYAITETVEPHYQPLLISFARQLIDEYKCEAPSEKAMAEAAALAYIRVITFSAKIHGIRRMESTSPEINGYYAIIGKELDRANRHYQTSIATLRQMKQPPLTVQVNAKTALIAQNQQINAGMQPAEEIYDPK